MQLLTLVTDWGTKDHFIGTMKAKLYSHIQDLQVVDITHEISPFNISTAAFIVKNACLNFPKGTIHIIDIESVETNENTHVLIEYNDQYFICTDNGLPSLAFPKNNVRVFQINVYQDSNFFTFAALDLFAKVAIELFKGTEPSALGQEVNELIEKKSISPNFTGSKLIASVIYIDHYGNAYLNVRDEEFEQYCNGRNFKLLIRNKLEIEKLSLSYNDVDEADMLLTISSTGHLQIAINKGSIAQLEGVRIHTNVVFEFGEKESNIFA